MNFINKALPKKNVEENIETEVIDNGEHEGFMQTAEMTAAIVTKGLESGDFSKINEQLENLPMENNKSQQ